MTAGAAALVTMGVSLVVLDCRLAVFRISFFYWWADYLLMVITADAHSTGVPIYRHIIGWPRFVKTFIYQNSGLGLSPSCKKSYSDCLKKLIYFDEIIVHFYTACPIL